MCLIISSILSILFMIIKQHIHTSFEQFVTEYAQKRGICIYYTAVISPSKNRFAEIVRHIFKDTRSRVVVLFLQVIT